MKLFKWNSLNGILKVKPTFVPLKARFEAISPILT
jgi:hypothetical protein